MAINLLDMLKDQISDSVLSQAGSFLGESDSSIKSAMGAALPSILASMISKGSDAKGAGGLMDMISKGNHDGSIFNDLGSLMGGGDATSGFLNSGSGILKSLLGNKLGSVVDIISSVSGLKKGSSSSIMSMAAPLVMGMVGKYLKSKALDALGLSKFLGSQSRHVASALPAGMGNLLGFSGLSEKASSAVNTARETVPAGGDGGGWMKRVLPILGLLAIGYLGWNFFLKDTSVGDTMKDVTENVTDAAGDAVSTVGETVGDAASAAGEMANDAAGAVGDLAAGISEAAISAGKKALEGVTFAAGSVGDKFSTWLSSGGEGEQVFRFNNLNFATGSATIEDMTEIDNLAKVMAAFPSVEIEIGGHTDNTGNAEGNNKLSQQRADAVMAQLAKMGVGASRMAAKGYGSSMPTASNDTDAGKAQNRRIEVKVTKK